jgi:D-alanine transfer protein
MKTPHLVSAAAALALLVAALATATIYARQREARDVHALAAQTFAPKTQGSGLQRAAFRQPDLLPLYGSSDLTVPNRYHASALFRVYPTGFTVFPVGQIGSTSLIWLQALAAVGADLYGKKVAVSLPARWFMNEMADRHAYAANFSPLHAGELAFSTALSYAVKQGAARRMLQYPETLANDPLLAFALEQLAEGSLRGRVLYYASLPLGKLHNLVLRLQDHWETLVFLHAQLGLQPAPRHGADLDWTDLLNRAEQETRRKAGSNPFGFENAFWATQAPDIARQKDMYASETVRRNFERSAEWTDFELLLRAISDLGGQPLILGIPMNGAYYDYLGVPVSTRRAYYERLHELAAAHGVLAIDFSEHDSDKYFTADSGFHLSDEGWIYYDQALDAFVHDQKRGNT